MLARCCYQVLSHMHAQSPLSCLSCPCIACERHTQADAPWHMLSVILETCACCAAAVNTPMTEGMFIPERCLQPADIAEAAMLALRTSSACVPSEITLRLTLPAAK